MEVAVTYVTEAVGECHGGDLGGGVEHRLHELLHLVDGYRCIELEPVVLMSDVGRGRRDVVADRPEVGLLLGRTGDGGIDDQTCFGAGFCFGTVLGGSFGGFSAALACFLGGGATGSAPCWRFFANMLAVVVRGAVLAVLAALTALAAEGTAAGAAAKVAPSSASPSSKSRWCSRSSRLKMPSIQITQIASWLCKGPFAL